MKQSERDAGSLDGYTDGVLLHIADILAVQSLCVSVFLLTTNLYIYISKCLGRYPLRLPAPQAHIYSKVTKIRTTVVLLFRFGYFLLVKGKRKESKMPFLIRFVMVSHTSQTEMRRHNY